jgi:hypothetical protein
MQRLDLIRLATLIVLLVSVRTQAQDPDKRGDFFKKNFAETPLRPKEGGDDSSEDSGSGFKIPGNATVPGISQQDLDKMIKDGQEKWQKEFGETMKTPVPMKRMDSKDMNGDLTGLVRPLRVRAIGGIINSVDIPHYEKSLQQLVDLAVAKDLDVSTVYVMGNMKTSSETELITKILGRGGVVRFVNSIPAGYDVSYSPTWIVKTKEGEVLLEGVSGLEKYFNQRGEFLMREERGAPTAPNSHRS